MATDDGPTARPVAGRPSCLQHYRLGGDSRAVALHRFLDSENLVRRWRGVVDHLSGMPADPRQIAHTAWALTALNVIGWTLPPSVALTAGGMRPRRSWADAMACLAVDDVGPFEVLVSPGELRATADLREAGGSGIVAEPSAAGRPSAHGSPESSDPAPLDPGPPDLALLVGLADDVMSALRAAGCPPGQTTSGLGSCLGTMARQCSADSAEARVTQQVWAYFSPEPTMPGDPAFRRPLCCGLMRLARTDAAACGDCPHR